MTYKIDILPEVLEEDLKKLNKHLKHTFCAAIRERIAERPYDFKPLKGKKYYGTWRLRIGDYRIVYYIDEKQNLVTILRFGVRSKVYDKLETRVNSMKNKNSTL